MSPRAATWAPLVTDVMGRQAPEGLLGIHMNLLVTVLAGPQPGESEQERAAADQFATFRESGFGYFLEMATRPQTIGYALLDSPVALARLAARPRHGQLLQDLPRLRRRRARGQSHPGPHRRQHHAVLADGHRRLGGPVVLGGRKSPGSSTRVRPGSSGRSRSRSASPPSPARSGGPRAAGSRTPTPTSPTSTRSTGAATSPPGRSRNSSPRNYAPRSPPCDDASALRREATGHRSVGKRVLVFRISRASRSTASGVVPQQGPGRRTLQRDAQIRSQVGVVRRARLPPLQRGHRLLGLLHPRMAVTAGADTDCPDGWNDPGAHPAPRSATGVATPTPSPSTPPGPPPPWPATNPAPRHAAPTTAAPEPSTPP